MKRDLEKSFLSAYHSDGVVDNCISVLELRYDLSDAPKSKRWKDFLFENTYNTEFIDNIKKATEAFDDTVIYAATGTFSPLFDEVNDNILECRTLLEKECYIVHSLITPFKGLSEFLYPNGIPLKRIEHEFQECLLFDERITGIIGTKDKEGTPDESKQEKERQLRIRTILANPTDIVEASFSQFCRIMLLFADQLDAILVCHQLDLFELQKKCGIYLKSDRIVTDVDYYMGREYAENRISELSNSPAATEVPNPTPSLEAESSQQNTELSNKPPTPDTPTHVDIEAKTEENPMLQINEAGMRKLIDPSLFRRRQGEKTARGTRLLLWLQKPREDKKMYARIAYILFHSKYINTSETFTEWLPMFSFLMNVEDLTKSGYDRPKKFDDDKKMRLLEAEYDSIVS